MKIIDEKGRLFGKINIIDFLILLFLSGIILPMCFFGTKIFKVTESAKANKEEVEMVTIEVKKLKEIKIERDLFETKFKNLQTQTQNFFNKHPRAKKYF